MTGLKGVWDAGDLAIVHAVGMPSSESTSRSHFEATDYWERGSASMSVTNGWLARYMTSAGIGGALPAIAYDSSVPMSLRGNKGSMAINSIESFNVEGFWNADLGNDALSHVYTTGTIDPLVQQGADTLAAVALVEVREPAAVRHPCRPLSHRMGPDSGWAKACARWPVCSARTSACASPASISTAGTTTTPWALPPAG